MLKNILLFGVGAGFIGSSFIAIATGSLIPVGAYFCVLSFLVLMAAPMVADEIKRELKK